MNDLDFACPSCRTPLKSSLSGERFCPTDGIAYRRVEGIWRFLTEDRLEHFRQFMREYETVRREEGRGSGTPEYYRGLPFRDTSGHFSDNWRIRARSFEALRERVVQPLETRREGRLRILDLGAGNGWLSYRLALRGHRVAAVDLSTDRLDGLGTWVHYDAAFTPVQAEFDRLPFETGQTDLALFNASLHYSEDFASSLAEALRVVRSEGLVAIVDSPVYRDANSGARMVRERESQFLKQYGFPSNAISSENYLTYDRLDQLGTVLGLRWERIVPWYGLRWALRPWIARLRGSREPAKFMVLVGRRR